MKQEILDKWIARLRDPSAKKARGQLWNKSGMCCLGHLGDVCGLSKSDMSNGNGESMLHLDMAFLQKVELPTSLSTELADLNDTKAGFPIDEIIKLVPTD